MLCMWTQLPHEAMYLFAFAFGARTPMYSQRLHIQGRQATKQASEQTTSLIPDYWIRNTGPEHVEAHLLMLNGPNSHQITSLVDVGHHELPLVLCFDVGGHELPELMFRFSVGGNVVTSQVLHLHITCRLSFLCLVQSFILNISIFVPLLSFIFISISL